MKQVMGDFTFFFIFSDQTGKPGRQTWQSLKMAAYPYLLRKLCINQSFPGIISTDSGC